MNRIIELNLAAFSAEAQEDFKYNIGYTKNVDDLKLMLKLFPDAPVDVFARRGNILDSIFGISLSGKDFSEYDVFFMPRFNVLDLLPDIKLETIPNVTKQNDGTFFAGIQTFEEQIMPLIAKGLARQITLNFVFGPGAPSEKECKTIKTFYPEE